MDLGSCGFSKGRDVWWQLRSRPLVVEGPDDLSTKTVDILLSKLRDKGFQSSYQRLAVIEEGTGAGEASSWVVVDLVQDIAKFTAQALSVKEAL
jgi:hypothetical protein